MELLAAIDDTRLSAGVLDTAVRIAALLSVDIEAVTVYGEDAASAARMAGEARVPLRLLFGDPATAVLRALDEDDVVLATLGAGRAYGAGLVTRGVITQSTKPVVVVPRHARPWTASGAARVVAPLDGAEATTSALVRHLRVFADRGAEVIALHVFNGGNAPRYWDHPYYDALAWQQEFLRRRGPVPGCRLQVALGSVVRATVDLAVREQAVLIAVAWAQDLSSGHGRIVNDLLRSSPVPVLLLPAVMRARPAALLAVGAT